MQEQDNSFKQIEPTDEQPRPELKKRVMTQIEINRAIGDIFKVFTSDMGRSVLDLTQNKKPEM